MTKRLPSKEIEGACISSLSVAQNNACDIAPPEKDIVFPGYVAEFLVRGVGLGNLHPSAIAGGHDVGVVGAKVGNFLDLASEKILVNGRPLLADFHLLRAHCNRHRHVERAANTMPYQNFTNAGDRSAAVGLIHTQLAFKQVDVADETRHKPV